MTYILPGVILELYMLAAVNYWLYTQTKNVFIFNFAYCLARVALFLAAMGMMATWHLDSGYFVQCTVATVFLMAQIPFLDQFGKKK